MFNHILLHEPTVLLINWLTSQMRLWKQPELHELRKHNTTPSADAQINLQIAQMQMQQRELLEQITSTENHRKNATLRPRQR